MKKFILFTAFVFSFLISCTKEGPAGPAGKDGISSFSIFIGGDDQVVEISTTPTVSRQVSMTVNGPGTIILEASGYFFNNNLDIEYIGRASWSLNNTTMDQTYLSVVNGSKTNAFNPYHVIRGFDVSAAGTYNFYLLGNLNSSSDTIKMVKNYVVATFTPK